MLLYGASGHAKVIIDCLLSKDIEISGVFDDDATKKMLLSYKIVGKYDVDFLPSDKIIISIGDNLIRKRISKSIIHEFGNAINSTAVISNFAKIGKGNVIFQNAVIQSCVEIKNHVIVNTASCIDHDCILDSYVHLSPNATLCGNVSVGEGTHIGAGSVVIPNIKIGKWCIIGAGSVIINDIPDFSIVVGNPGKIIKSNTRNE